LLRNFAAYAAALAGYTAAIVAGDLLGATGGVNADAAFLLAISRGSEIIIGIVCAGVVLAATDLGDAPGAWLRSSRTLRRRLPPDLAAHWLWPGPISTTPSEYDGSSSAASLRSTP